MNVSGIDPKAILSSLRQIAAAPSANLRASVLIGVILLVLVLLVVSIAALVFSSVSARRRRAKRARLMARAVALKQRRIALLRAAEAGAEASTEQPPTPDEILAAAKIRAARRRSESAGRKGAARNPARSKRTAALMTWLGGIIIVLVVVGTYVATGTQQYCAGTCHAGTRAVTVAAKDAHQSVACVSCHEGPGVTALPVALASRTRHVAMQLTGRTAVATRPVPSDRCLPCHSAQIATVTTDPETGIRMSHAEPLAAGLTCAECHTQAGHGTVPAKGMMNVCVRCHNDRTAPAFCALCHKSDPGQAAAKQQTFPQVRMGPIQDCGGCHAQTTCDNCHGIRMPHTTDFIAGGHAKQGAFGGKTLCYRCHVVTDCGKCHDTSGANAAVGHPYWGHPGDWKTDHKAQPATSACGCHTAKQPPRLQGQPFCKLCH